MDLALNNLERLKCHKNQPTNIPKIVYCYQNFSAYLFCTLLQSAKPCRKIRVDFPVEIGDS